MVTDHTDCARYMAEGLPHIRKAPRAAAFCRQTSLRRTVFAMTLVVLTGMLPAVVLSSVNPLSSAQIFDAKLDSDHNGVEDLLDAWLSGRQSWMDLRTEAAPVATAPAVDRGLPAADFPGGEAPLQAVWAANQIRIICLGGNSAATQYAAELAAKTGACSILHDLDQFGGVQVLALDQAALLTFLRNKPDGRILLDRNGTPALDTSIRQVGGRQLAAGHWQLGEDWSATVAILDSGCDSAHDDLGDHSQDNIDGPPPAVGDATDWYPGDLAWPTFSGYRIVGWQDVTDDFPEAQGPWDYHYHGTALASVVAGSGRVLEDHKGVAPGGRLTVVKFYDFDQVWQTWAGDFLAACSWTLEHRDDYRIRVVLAAVNWDEDLGISDAMNELVAAGLLPVVAMGNFGTDGTDPGYPAAVPDVLTVGSVNDNGAVSAFSGRGKPGFGKPDMMAPGGGLLASFGRINVADNEPNDTYSGRSGTSLAAAHVAGAVFLLRQALSDNAVTLPADVTSTRTVKALLRATSGRIIGMENESGEDELVMSPHDFPDEIRGWGQLRIDAAVHAVLHPIFPGMDQVDTLTVGDQKTVIARRLKLQPGVRYLLEAAPSAGLDVDLALVDPRRLDFDPYGIRILRQNEVGAGVSEFAYHEGGDCEWAFLVVRRVSGQGLVTLRIHEADSFPQQGRLVTLPGVVTAPPNTGHLLNSAGVSVVIPSRVDLDPSARALTVLDDWGTGIPGWPVFVFPHPSSIGGLSQPLLWDLDGSEGDEIVVASDFGSLYFFNRIGAYDEIELPFNLPLTAPVGIETGGGTRQIAVVDDLGLLRFYSWGPILQNSRALNHHDPVQPAAGKLISTEPERLVVAFRDGTLSVLDFTGQDRPGWPLDLAAELTLPPVLADTNGDGHREILLPVHDSSTGLLRIRIFNADGTVASGDGTLLPSPQGGKWLQLAWPLMAGRVSTGDLRLEIMGLVDNGLVGLNGRWNLARTGWLATTNQSFSAIMPGFEVATTTTQGFLQLDKAIWTPPLAWNFQDGSGSDVAILAGFRWQEILYGQTSIPGSALGWFRPKIFGRPLESRQPVALGGIADPLGSSLAAVLVPISDDLFYQVQIYDNDVHLMPMHTGNDYTAIWPAARYDQRNSAAYPVTEDLSPVPVGSPTAGSLSVYPNPGPGRFHFRLKGGPDDADFRVDVFDLRGHRIVQLKPDPVKGELTWDGRDASGRASAAGAYLAVASWQGKTSVTRVVLTR